MPAQRVSSLELFFDLVFVFTITQLTATLTHEPRWRGLAQVGLMLGVIWWMYGGYAWLTNAVTLDGARRRALLLAGMAAYLVLALCIPHAFGHDGLAFGLAYLVIVLIHAGLFTRSGGRGAAGILRIAPFNLLTALLVLVGGAIGGDAQYVLWTLAFVAAWGTPYLVPPAALFQIGPSHFVERHGLVVIVAIGESVVAIGIGAQGLHVDLALVAVALLGLALSACLWRSYFGDGDDARAEQALHDAGEQSPKLALDAFGAWHLPLLLGIIAIAFGLKTATGHAFDPSALAPAVGLAGGAFAFLAGDAGFRRTLGFADGPARVTAAVLAPATIPLGSEVAPALQLAVLVALIAGALGAERGLLSPRPRG